MSSPQGIPDRTTTNKDVFSLDVTERYPDFSMQCCRITYSGLTQDIKNTLSESTHHLGLPLFSFESQAGLQSQTDNSELRLV